MIINDEIKSLIPPLTETEYSLLEQSILEEGCRDALITWNGTLLDGHNRYAICTKHNLPFKTQEMEFGSKAEAMAWMAKNQLGRRNLNNFQRAELALVYKPIFEEQAKERQRGGQGGVLLSPKSGKANTDKGLAVIAGVAHSTISQVSKVKTLADEDTIQKLRQGDISINEAYKKVRAEEKKQERIEDIEQQLEAIERGELPELEGLFDVVSIDPPWAYEERGGASSAEYDASSVRGTVTYPTMTLSELEQLNLPVKDDAVLFLWTTHAFLRDAFDLLETWGFDYKATIVWDKEKMGIGRNIRLQCEFCLLATKGSPYLNGGSVRDIIREPRREHSRKPEAFYELVETLTLGRKLDYFAREQREGWETYGNETDKF